MQANRVIFTWITVINPEHALEGKISQVHFLFQGNEIWSSATSELQI